MQVLTIDETKLSLAIAKGFASGSHSPTDGEMCVMEAAAYVAGEEWSDHPQCVCPVIAAFLRSWNDSLPAADRTRLLGPLLPVVIGTRADSGVELRRSYLAVDWLVRVCAPAWLDLIESLKPHADTLRALPELTLETIKQAEQPTAAARAAARAAAADAAATAATAAATAAADAAAAARNAAWAAAADALAPTVATLQEPAADLVRRMAALQTEDTK